MADSGDRLVHLRGVSKDYRALRPLRIQELELHDGQSLALLGLDRAAAEVLVSIITAATLPDAGEAHVLGRATSDITTGDEWLRWLDQFGVLSQRTVLVEQFTAEQNLAIAFSLDVEDLSPAVRADVRALASELGVAESDLATPVARLSAPVHERIRLGRAIARRPRMLLAEHPTAALSADDTPAFAADLSRIITGRKLASLVITADQTFASAVAEQVLTLQPGTGALKRAAGWRRWFS
jgi:ABC-type lipoprotein export system ATPase subunit